VLGKSKGLVLFLASTLDFEAVWNSVMVPKSGIFNLFLLGLIFFELALSRWRVLPGFSIKYKMCDGMDISYLLEMKGIADRASTHSSVALIACSFYLIPVDEYL